MGHYATTATLSGPRGRYLLDSYRTVRRRGRRIKAGLVQAVATKESLHEAARRIAKDIMRAAPLAVSYTKEALKRGRDLGLAAALELEADLYTLLQPTNDRREGVAAFLEHREARFKGE